jgi:hypothetical protein
MSPRSIDPTAKPDSFEAVRARNKLVDEVRAALSGSRLDIRDRTSALVISNPGHPDNGRIYITYTTAEVSLSRPVWRYLGHLQEHDRDHDPEAEPTVNAAAIIAALTSPPDTTTPARHQPEGA